MLLEQGRKDMPDKKYSLDEAIKRLEGLGLLDEEPTKKKKKKKKMGTPKRPKQMGNKAQRRQLEELDKMGY